jgi:quercetin dioxygenase-like cupin family protein
MKGGFMFGAGKRRRAVTLAGTVVVVLIFGTVFASATPGVGVTGPILARGTIAQPMTISVPKVVSVKVKKKVKGKMKTVSVKKTVAQIVNSCGPSGSCDTAVQQVTIQPAGSTGWHTHPGGTVVVVASGEGTLYHPSGSTCASEKYAAGTGFFQLPTEVHTFRNEGAVPLVVYAFYWLPSGTASTAIRVDQPQPASCPNIT